MFNKEALYHGAPEYGLFLEPENEQNMAIFVECLDFIDSLSFQGMFSLLTSN